MKKSGRLVENCVSNRWGQELNFQNRSKLYSGNIKNDPLLKTSKIHIRFWFNTVQFLHNVYRLFSNFMYLIVGLWEYVRGPLAQDDPRIIYN